MAWTASVRLKHLLFLNLIILFGASGAWGSDDYNWGAGVGFGGTGLQKVVSLDGADIDISRSEGPGVFSLFIDRPIGNSWGIGLEHTRGFRLGPFSAGFSFTEAFTRWYFMSPPVQLARSSAEKSFVFVKRYSPFIGGGLGLGGGTINREGDRIAEVTASGVVLGFRGGVDYAISPDYAIRPEIAYSTSLMASGIYPATLSKFAILCGFVFPF